MATVKLQVPTLVSKQLIGEQEHYLLRPLFIHYPVAAHRRYEQAVAQYRKEIRQFFKGYSLSRPQSDQLLWFLFRPQMQYHRLEIELHVNKQFIQGTFGAASFQLQGKTFVCLPRINNFVFMYDPRPGNTIKKASTRVIRELFTQIQRTTSEAVPYQRYEAGEKEFISQVELSVNIGQDPFSFDAPSNNWFFSTLMADSSFDGAVELEKTGENLNALYPTELDRAYHQEALVDQLYQLIFHPVRTPVALVGEEGIGKHAVLHELVYRYESGHYGNRPKPPERIWRLDPTRVISGMSIVGWWQKRMEAIIDYLRKPQPGSRVSDRLMIDNAVALLSIGKSASNDMTLTDVLRPYLEKRELQLILIATPEEWKTVQERGRRFSNLFRVIRMEPPRLETAIDIILEKRRRLEQEHDTEIKLQALQQLLDIQRNYLRDKPLPGSLLRLLGQLCVKYRQGVVDAPEVRQEFMAYSGLKEQIFDVSAAEDKEETARLISRELVGQPEAVRALSDVIHLVKAKLNNPQRPLSSFLFVGPTGVGKTQAAKVLSKFLKGSEEQLLRFDMNEYIDSGSLERLVGGPGQPEGRLTGAVRYQPFSILLLDEIEKAHPMVHDLLLQLLDDARLTDSLGRTVNFSNTIIIMTSNIGASEAGHQLGFGADNNRLADTYRRAMERFFRPELLNRIDQTIVFNPLQPEHILGIARLQIQELLKRDGFVRRATILNIEQPALQWVAQRGFDARMGGRALKRQIEKDLTALSAEQLVHTHTDVPLLMDIYLEEQALRPKIRPLSFAERLSHGWLPETPEETRGKPFYLRLLRALEYVRGRLERYETDFSSAGPVVFTDGESSELGWEYYDYKAKVAQVQEETQNISLGFRDRYYKIGPAIPLRLKAVKLVPRREDFAKGIRENIRDLVFQQEGIEEISDAYRYANVQFDSLKTEFYNYFLKVAFLELQLRALLSEEPMQVRLTVASMVEGMGKEEVAYLLDLYARILSELDFSHKVLKEEQAIEIKGLGVSSLMSGEAGMHLFYRGNRNPVPVQVRLNEAPSELTVIRLYHEGKTLTDLRTGFSNDSNITANEFAMLLYAGLPEEIRRQVNPFRHAPARH